MGCSSSNPKTIEAFGDEDKWSQEMSGTNLRFTNNDKSVCMIESNELRENTAYGTLEIASDSTNASKVWLILIEEQSSAITISIVDSKSSAFMSDTYLYDLDPETNAMCKNLYGFRISEGSSLTFNGDIIQELKNVEWEVGDVIMIALDMHNKTLKYGRNCEWFENYIVEQLPDVMFSIAVSIFPMNSLRLLQSYTAKK